MSGAIYVCIKQFNARLGDELNLKVGDRIEVLADDSEYNDGWYMGRNVVSNKVGLFPKLFTQLAVDTKPLEPTLLRSRSRRLPSGASSSAASNGSKQRDASYPATPSLAKAANGLDKTPADVHHTMNEIDKALHELQVLSLLDPQKGHSRSESALLLTQDLNPLKAASWTPKQVSLYFAIVLGFDMEVAGKFARHKITGEILFELDLAHLKELEIDSFGTRFEVYKEIDKLKQINNRAKTQASSQPTRSVEPARAEEATQEPDALASKRVLRTSPPFNNSDDDRAQAKANEKSLLLPSVQLDTSKKSATVARTPSAASRLMYGHLRTRSQSMENIPQYLTPKSPTNEYPVPGSFMSPRKAPEPPSASPMNKNYRFGGSPMTPQNNYGHLGLYMTRTNASSAALSQTGNGNGNGNGGFLRPASSIYDGSVLTHHRRESSNLSNSHRRHSSVFSFLSGNNDENTGGKEKLQSQNLYKGPSTPARTTASPGKRLSRFFGDSELTNFGDDAVDIDEVGLSPKKDRNNSTVSTDAKKKENPQGRLKSLRSVSTQNFRNLTVLKKLKTSAFQEGIREINPDDAIKTSNFSGWMSKKSGSTLGWRSRYFTLHGTRLSYFTSLRDKREKGLIDITAHKVIPISTEGDQSASNDKYIALYAALTGFGRYCFKLVPPAPGFKKGLTFTQPKTHFFAVETQEEMRGWLKALMTATIDIDDSVPVVSSCNTPTVTLAKAQELLAKAREETKLKDEELRAKGFIRDGEYFDDSTNGLTFYNNSVTSDEASPVVGSIDETTISSNTGGNATALPKLSVDTLSKSYRSPGTPQASTNSGGFASPYLLASGLLSPKLGPPSGSVSTNSTPYLPQNKEISEESLEVSQDLVRPPTSDEHSKSQSSLGSSSPKPVFANSNGRVLSGKNKKEKLLAYTSDGSFVIKSKK